MTCENKKNGVCQLHNIHCAYPDCENHIREVAINKGSGCFRLTAFILKRLVLKSAQCMKIEDLGLDEMTTDVGDGFTQGIYDQAIAYNNKIYVYDNTRDDSDLIEILKELEKGTYSSYKIVEIPSNVKFEVCSNEDGSEWIAEVHRTWS